MQSNILAKNFIMNKLQTNPQQFEFFQAVRLLQLIAQKSEVGRDCRIGHCNDPKQEAIRFRTPASLSFPTSSIEKVKINQLVPANMLVNFIGLTGPSGVLPDHYTELLIQRLQLKDTVLSDFLDLFNHRIISLFYRAWEKYRFYLAYDSSQLSNNRPNSFNQLLSSLLGLGTSHLAQRLAVPDEALFFYGGAFARQPRSASMLAALLQGYFNLPCKVKQFHGNWLQLEQDSCSQMPSRSNALGQYIELGINIVLGRRSWDVQSKFRLQIGPLSYSQFMQLLPSGSTLKPLTELTRFYVGMNLSFDIQLQLKANEVPFCTLRIEQPNRLGWDSWLKTRAVKQDAMDTIIIPRI